MQTLPDDYATFALGKVQSMSNAVEGAAPELVLHVVPASHPCIAVLEGIKRKGLDHRVETLGLGDHVAAIEEIYGPGCTTVPGLLVDGEPVHGSSAIYAKLDELSDLNPMYPEPIADAVREAEAWADGALQGAARVLTWGAMHFRPESMGTFGGAGELDPGGTDYAIKFIRGAWKHIGISAKRVAESFAELPDAIDRVDALAGAGVIDGEVPNAADLQIASSARLMLTIGDVRPLLAGRTAERLALELFPEMSGDIPAGGVPAAWIPSPAASGHS